MDRDIAVALLKRHEPELRKLGVEGLFLFGSTIHGDARPDSDVDLFFDHPTTPLSLFDIMGIEAFAGEVLGCKADVMTRDSLHPMIKDEVEAEAHQVF